MGFIPFSQISVLLFAHFTLPDVKLSMLSLERFIEAMDVEESRIYRIANLGTARNIFLHRFFLFRFSPTIRPEDAKFSFKKDLRISRGVEISFILQI